MEKQFKIVYEPVYFKYGVARWPYCVYVFKRFLFWKYWALIDRFTTQSEAEEYIKVLKLKPVLVKYL